jgi:hypothetical protein
VARELDLVAERIQRRRAGKFSDYKNNITHSSQKKIGRMTELEYLQTVDLFYDPIT